MNLMLKELFCAEWEQGQEILLTDSTVSFVTAYIGTGDNDDKDGFTMVICNTEYVKKKVEQDGYFIGRWHFVTQNPSRNNIENFFLKLLIMLDKDTWEENINSLKKIARYEYDYDNL